MSSKEVPTETDEAMDAADEANGVGRQEDEPTNDTEERYGENESPA